MLPLDFDTVRLRGIRNGGSAAHPMRLSSAREERREVGIMVSSVASSPKCKKVIIMKTDQICNSPGSGKIQDCVTKLILCIPFLILVIAVQDLAAAGPQM
jgi:hypothetical protein